MKEKVVYLLGAGFSAPLGLPVMSDFLFKSKDQYVENREKYSYFEEVFNIIHSLAVVKNYFKANLFNIEEILSILEMQTHLGRGEAGTHNYINYLCDVVEYYTPTFKLGKAMKEANWFEQLFTDETARHGHFGNFVACLFNLAVRDNRWTSPSELLASVENESQVAYSVVTLNYDLVLEKLCEHIGSFLRVPMAFSLTQDNVDDDWFWAPYLAKLHGTVASGKVIPPTWNKGLHPEMIPVWQLAYKLLSTATQIRILGYSLPETDSYVKYLLKSAITEARRLKQIDVICLDPKHDVRARYDEFIDFPNYRIAAADVLSYLYYKTPREVLQTKFMKYNFLEELHGRVTWSSVAIEYRPA
jgi:hypothetical protein